MLPVCPTCTHSTTEYSYVAYGILSIPPLSDNIPSHQQSLSVLRDSQPFVKYILNVSLQKIHQVYTYVCRQICVHVHIHCALHVAVLH